MRPADRDPMFQAHQLCKHLRARDYRNFLFVSLDDFRIVRLDRRRGHNHVRPFHIFRPVAVVDHRAKILQALSDGRKLDVRARNGIAERQQHLRDSAHADAADAHQMNALKISERDHHEDTAPGCSRNARGKATSSI